MDWPCEWKGCVELGEVDGENGLEECGEVLAAVGERPMPRGEGEGGGGEGPVEMGIGFATRSLDDDALRGPRTSTAVGNTGAAPNPETSPSLMMGNPGGLTLCVLR